ncbi:DUF1579 domain-containing protein [Chitinimonas sp. BJYL2]|uniref:DUF1579 domain-containing protein n=1 Tax=Chitinimonas sp. BJYL2 TaxID=2976696 RepID=UPI0022B4D3FC|nr:DUF1579 domain-containing protein [Chitinimonas sp. BJYL2]
MLRIAACLISLSLIGTTALANGRPDPAKTLPAQREAQSRLAVMDGEWRGTAWTLLPNGEKHTLTQTERVGTLLDGTIRLVEGRGYTAEGTTAFNAFAVISYNPATQTYSMRSHAQGQTGDFTIKPSDTGFSWEIPAGPMTIRYTATIKGKQWREVGERIMPGRDPVQFFEMNLERIGDSSWPAGAPVSPKP